MNWRAFLLLVLGGVVAGFAGATWWLLRAVGRAVEQINP